MVKPDYGVLAEQLLGDLPHGPRGQIEQVLFGAIANIEAVAFAVEIGFPADCWPLCFQFGRLLLGERAPGGGIVSFHAGQIGGDSVPHIIAGLATEFGIEHGWQHQKAIAFELGNLICCQESGLRHIRGLCCHYISS